MQTMLKACLHRCIDAEVGHNAADHHIFFVLFRQIFQQAALFFERTAYSLDEPFFSQQWRKPGIDLEFIVPDGETCLLYTSSSLPSITQAFRWSAAGRR